MNLDENLKNAVKVLRETYNSIDKLAKYLREKAPEFGYRCVTDNILLWQSKSNTWGWVASKFTLLFQHSNQPIFENGWSDDDIYGVEICFDDVACLNIAKLIYSNGLREWSSGCKPSDEWGFTHPKWNKSKFDIFKKGEFKISKPLNLNISKDYWGLSAAIYKGESFYDLTSQNIKEKIFDVMDLLTGYNLDFCTKV